MQLGGDLDLQGVASARATTAGRTPRPGHERRTTQSRLSRSLDQPAHARARRPRAGAPRPRTEERAGRKPCSGSHTSNRTSRRTTAQPRKTSRPRVADDTAPNMRASTTVRACARPGDPRAQARGERANQRQGGQPPRPNRVEARQSAAGEPPPGHGPLGNRRQPERRDGDSGASRPAKASARASPPIHASRKTSRRSGQAPDGLVPTGKRLRKASMGVSQSRVDGVIQKATASSSPPAKRRRVALGFEQDHAGNRWSP